MDSFLGFELLNFGDKSFKVQNLVLMVLVLVMASLIIWLIKKILSNRLKRLKSVDHGRRFAILSIAKYFIYCIAFMLLFEAAGINVTVLIAGSTALFVGLGFGLQNTFNDVVSGIILLFEGNLEIDDIVDVDGTIGRVEQIGLRTSTIQTRDDISIMVPNSLFVSQKVVNWSHQSKLARFQLQVGVAYGSDTQLVKQCLIKVAREHKDVLKEPDPTVLFRDFADSALVFDLIFWSKRTFEAEFTKSDLRFEIDRIFRSEGITIPFPQRDIHVNWEKRDLEKGDS